MLFRRARLFVHGITGVCSYILMILYLYRESSNYKTMRGLQPYHLVDAITGPRTQFWRFRPCACALLDHHGVRIFAHACFFYHINLYL